MQQRLVARRVRRVREIVSTENRGDNRNLATPGVRRSLLPQPEVRAICDIVGREILERAIGEPAVVIELGRIDRFETVEDPLRKRRVGISITVGEGLDLFDRLPKLLAQEVIGLEPALPVLVGKLVEHGSVVTSGRRHRRHSQQHGYAKKSGPRPHQSFHGHLSLTGPAARPGHSELAVLFAVYIVVVAIIGESGLSSSYAPNRRCWRPSRARPFDFDLS